MINPTLKLTNLIVEQGCLIFRNGMCLGFSLIPCSIAMIEKNYKQNNLPVMIDHRFHYS